MQPGVPTSTSAEPTKLNVTLRFMTILSQEVHAGEINVESAERESRGSPFPMPARLADGLAQGSELKAICRLLRPVRPDEGTEIWVPRAGPQEGGPASAAMC